MSSPKIEVVYIDHYDSFSRNVIDWLLTSWPQLLVTSVSYEKVDLLQDLTANPRPLIFSPGPHAPQDYQTSLHLMQKFLHKVPMLGVCLGHQLLGITCGLNLAKSQHTLHGIPKTIKLTSKNRLFDGLPGEFEAMSYNSLILQESSQQQSDAKIDGVCQNGEVQAISLGRMAFGVQFHPESFKSDDLAMMAKNFYEICREWKVGSVT
jgi:anthranilate synthase/aminodeoxychorismate synthase-like glutamine amidotransferase